MYDYRKMTEDEKRQVLEIRKERKYPYHRPPHLCLGEGFYLVTAATFEHVQHFKDPDELSALEIRILEALNHANIQCRSWVILPNHYHLLLELENPMEYGGIIAPVHRKSALYCNKRDKVFNRKVWYKYADRKIRSEKHYWATVFYILQNPLKHGFVDKPEDWLWSSHGIFTEKEIVKMRKECNIDDYGKNWDDY